MSRQRTQNISLNVQIGMSQNFLQLPDGSHTPNTPEILNSIVNMQMSSYETFKPDITTGIKNEDNSPTENIAMKTLDPRVSESTSQSSLSVGQYRSQFIKEGLKIKLSKQKATRSSAIGNISSNNFVPKEEVKNGCVQSRTMIDTKSELTDDDKIRRQRRRERNKVAASKCRDKKKVWTQLLFSESESLIRMNCSLKSEVQHLEQEKQKLVKILKLHEPSCTKRSKEVLPMGQPVLYQDNFINHNTSSQLDPIQSVLPLGPNIYEMSTVPNISVKIAPMTEDEIFSPTDPGVYFDPPSFANFSIESENNFLGMRPISSAYLNSYNRIQSYHNSETQCLAL